MTEPAHILVVDDDASIRRMLQILLADAGYRVSLAASGEETLAYIDLVTPDLILLDFMLPGINGRDVARQIKANPNRPFIPIILVTARNDSQSKVSALDAGADDFLSKPVEFAELLARVRALLRLQRSQRSLRSEQRKTELLLHLSRELGTTLDLDGMLTHFLERLADAIGAVRASLILTLGEHSRLYSSSRYSSSISVQQIMANGVAGWVLREKEALVIGDTSGDSRWLSANSFHQVVRSVAAAPILREGRVLGVITVVHHTPNHFTDEHINLLTSVAQQSAFTLENAELFRLTRRQKELLERRAEELQRLNEVSRHLSELMQPDLLMRLVTHLIHYTFGYKQVSILLREEGGLRARASAGQLVPETYLGILIPNGKGITGWVVEHRRALNIPDVHADQRYVSVHGEDNVRSEVAVPIFAGRELFGVLEVASEVVDAFDANDEQLLGTLAGQLGVALDNARLFETEKRRVRQLGQVNDLSVAITAQLDRMQNLQIAADALAAIFGIERSAIVIYDEDARRGTWVASGGAPQTPPDVLDQLLFPPEGATPITSSAQLFTNVAGDERFKRYFPILLADKLESLALAPLISDGTTIGMLVLDVSHCANQFGQAELTLLTAIASLLAQVVENDRLYREVEDERQTLNAVLDGAADPILLIGPEDELLLSNRAAAEHLGIQTAGGMPIEQHIMNQDLLAALRARANGSGPHEVSIDAATTFSVSVAPVQSENTDLGRVAVLQDISAIKELERREQERLRGALRRYVSPQVVEQVLAGGQNFGKPVERDVVVLFADLRGYTSLTEGIDPHVLVNDVLNRYFTAMTEVLYRYEGTIDKFLGDGIIGVFGTPIAHADDLQRALLASVDLQRAFHELRHRWRDELCLDIGMGIGLGYGPAVVGNIGSTQRTDFTLIGDVVNTANRISGIAKAGQIIVSHQLVDALPRSWRSPYPLRELGPTLLKGKQEPHLIYEVGYET